MGGGLREHLLHELAETGRQGRIELLQRARVVNGEGHEHRHRRIAAKRRSPGGQAVQDTAEAEQVRAGIDGLVAACSGDM